MIFLPEIFMSLEEILKMKNQIYSILFFLFGIPAFAQNLEKISEYLSQGNNYYRSGDYDKALSYYNESLAYCKKRDGNYDENAATVLSNICYLYEEIGDYKTALTYAQKAYEIHKQYYGTDSLESAKSYRDIGYEHYYLGNYEEAQKYLLDALRIREAITGSTSAETAEILMDLATIFSIDSAKCEKALELIEQTEHIYTKLNINPISTEFADLYKAKGVCLIRLDQVLQAIHYYQKAQEIYIQIYGEQSRFTAEGYNLLGEVYNSIGDTSRALSNFQNAATTYISIVGNEHPSLAFVYSGIAYCYLSNDDLDNALLYFKKALDINIAVFGKQHYRLSGLYNEIGYIYSAKKDYKTALAYYQKSYDILSKHYSYDDIDFADLYDNIAITYSFLELFDKAEQYKQQALTIRKNYLGDDNPDTAYSYWSLGMFYAGQLNTEKAVENFRKSYSGFRKGTNYKQIIVTQKGILKNAELYQLNSNISFIRETIKLATDTIERARLDMPSIKTDILRQSIPIYYYGVDFEAKNNNPAKAFEYSEMLRSRGFLEQIGLDRALSLDGVSDAERKEIKQLTSKITLARKEIEMQNNLTLKERNNEKLSQAGKDLADAEKALAKLDATIGKKLPTYTQLRNPQTVKIKDAQKWCGKNRAILEYVLWNPELVNETDMSPYNNGSLKLGSYCLVITNKSVVAVPLDSNYDFTAAVAKLRDGIIPKRAKPTPETVFEDVRNELYKKLIGQVLPYIKDNKELLIVPDGSLSFLPFDVLRKDESAKMLCDQYAISLSPSVSVSMIADSTSAKGLEMLAFGGAWYDTSLSPEEQRRSFSTESGNRGFTLVIDDSEEIDSQNKSPTEYFLAKNIRWQNLPGTITELNTLHNKVVGTKKYAERVQEEASEYNIKKMSHSGLLLKYPILHFACHGYFDKNNAEMSSILFSEVSGKLKAISQEDGYLTIPEASVLNLNADIVCLSACETGLGEVKSGDGMTGLSRAFMVAGARHVGVSLWQVHDEATAQFMASMYKKIEKKGMSYEQAYRQTKVEFQKSNEFSHPYYWSAFVLYE